MQISREKAAKRLVWLLFSHSLAFFFCCELFYFRFLFYFFRFFFFLLTPVLREFFSLFLYYLKEEQPFLSEENFQDEHIKITQSLVAERSRIKIG